MSGMNYFFAGGGTGGHIYPGIAIAQRIAETAPNSPIHFLCSSRLIDSQILTSSGFDFTALDAKAFSFRPDKLASFLKAFRSSYNIAKQMLFNCDHAVVIGIGGFASAAPVLAACKLGIDIYLLNVDIVPGRANKLLARFAREIFVQFEDTVRCFAKTKAKVWVTGCPLRKEFYITGKTDILEQLSLDSDKKILVVMGGSSGARSINEAVCTLLEKLDDFADDWQIVHLTGVADFDKVSRSYDQTKIRHIVLEYYEQIAGLLRQADLVIGRSGAVSVAEYAAAAIPSICIPYPHHRDRHQYLNAEKLVVAGAAVVVDDLPNLTDRLKWLWEELEGLLADTDRLKEMKRCCAKIAGTNAAAEIAERLSR